MRILHVVPTYLPAVRYGGTIFAVHSLCRALAAGGHHITVFTTNVNGDRTSDVTLQKPVAIDGVQVRYFPSPLLRRLFWAPAMGRALQEEAGGFDVVHTHSVFLWPTAAAARAARQARVPYVISPHGMLVKDLIRARSRLAKTAWINLIERKSLGCAAAIHVTSALEDNELRRFGWNLPQIVKIANGVDEPAVGGSSSLASDVVEVSSKQPLVLFLGRLSWKKGLDRLLRAFALADIGHLAIAGPDDEKLSASLSQLANRLGIGHRVTLITRVVEGADKEQLFAAARVFVLPSHSENFGNTVLEALRRAVPVVVSRNVGAAEIVCDAGAGLVVTNEPEPLSRALRTLLSDADLASHLGAAGQRFLQTRYSWPTVALEIETLYKKITDFPASAVGRLAAN